MTTKSGIEMRRHDTDDLNNIELLTCSCCQTQGYQDNISNYSPTAKGEQRLYLCGECLEMFFCHLGHPDSFESDVIGQEAYDLLSDWVKAEQPQPDGVKITKTKDEQGRQCYEWQAGDKGGYARTREDAINDAKIASHAPSEAKFTPGPWQVQGMVSGHVLKIASGGGEVIADVCDLPRQSNHKQKRANADLLAASPDLLAACEAAYDLGAQMGCECSIPAESHAAHCWLGKVENAIAKAKGGAK